MGVCSRIWHAIIRQWRSLLRLYFRRFYTLEVQPFSADCLPHVQDFDCGDEVWEVPLSNWIKGDGALNSIRDHGNEVWLYWHKTEVVGFGSVGKTQRAHPTPTSPKIQMAIIPKFAINKKYRGKPKHAAKDERFAGQMLNHMIYQASRFNLQLLVLDVYQGNMIAKKFYKKFGFQLANYTHRDYERMFIRLQ